MVATTDLAVLGVGVVADTRGLATGLRQGERALTTFSARSNRALARVQRGFVRAESKALAFAKRLVGFNAIIGAAAGTAGLGLLIKNTINSADEIAKLADSIGISTDFLQEFRFAADLAGSSTAQADKGLRQLAVAVGEARGGYGTLTTALKKNNPELLANIRASRDTEDGIRRFLRGLADLPPGLDRAALAAAAFGRRNLALNNIIKDGVPAFNANLQAARDLGIVLEERLLRGAERAKDEWTKFSAVLSTAVSRIILENANELAQAAVKLTEGAVQLGKAIELIPLSLTDKLKAAQAEVAAKTEAAAEAERKLAATLAKSAGIRAAALPSINALVERTRAELDAAQEVEASIKRQIDLREKARSSQTAPAPARPAVVDAATLARQVREAQKSVSPLLADPFAAEQQAAVEATTRATERLKSELAAARSIVESTQTPLERYVEQLRLLNQATELGVISVDDQFEAVQRLRIAFEDASRKTDELDAAAAGAATGGLDAIIFSGGRAQDVLRDLAAAAARTIFQLTLLKDLQNAIEGTSDGGTAAFLKRLGISLATSGASTAGTGVALDDAVSGVTLQGAALGGPQLGGRPILVGEQGPEIFTPDRSGFVQSTPALARAMRSVGGNGGGVTVINQNDFRGAGPGVRAEIARAAPALIDASRRAVISDMNRGGAAARASGRRREF